MQELHGHYLDDLEVGMTAMMAKTVTEADIVLFAGVSGDFNPMHINEEFAQPTAFKGRIAHGMLTASLISAALGMKLPGPGCIYLKQELRFKAPVRTGDTVQARVTVREIIHNKQRVVLDTVASVDGTVVLEGEATLMVPVRKQ